MENSNNDLLEVIIRLCNGGYEDEESLNKDIDYLISNTNDPNVVDYIYSIKYNLTPEEILEKALSYKPILL